MLEEVRKKPKFEQRMLMFQNYYLGGARECELDAHGRILIPPALRKYANLRRDVVLVSALEKFRASGPRGVEPSLCGCRRKAFAGSGFFNRARDIGGE